MKYITAQAMIAKVIRDYNIADMGWVEDAKLHWVKEALQAIGTNGNKILVRKDFDVTDIDITFPCDLEDLIGLSQNGCFVRFQGELGLNKYIHTEELRPYVENEKVKFNKTGQIKGTMYYMAFPEDCNDEPLVVDHVKVTEAIMNYIMLRLMMRGMKHPVISYTDAYTLWGKTRDEASNYLAFPAPYEISTVLSDFPNPM